VSLEQEMQAALGSFVVEARELLTQMESDLLGLEAGDGDEAREMVNAVFRAAHTIKGSSGLFGLDHIVRFTHVMESVLDRLRADEIPVSSELINAMLPCADHLTTLVAGVAEGRLAEDPDDAEVGAALIDGLRPFLDGRSAGASAGGEGAEGAVGADTTAGATGGDGPRQVFGYLRFGEDCLRNGMDPLAFIRYLSTLGEIVEVVPLADLLPDAHAYDAEACYLAFAAVLRTDASLEVVADVFEFVRDSSTIVVLGPESTLAAYGDLVRDAGEFGQAVRDVLVDARIVDAATLDALVDGRPLPAASVPASRSGSTSKGGRTRAGGRGNGRGKGRSKAAGTVPAQPAAGRKASAPARIPAQGSAAAPDDERRAAERRTGSDRRASDAAEAKGAALKESRSIRIDATRLDRLIDAVGELVIAGASAELGASQNRDEALLAALGEVMRLVEEVRDSALQLRMVPIGTTFSRFQRVVRDVSAQLGKDIGLVISGGDTEVDKALVEQIADPLMHLVRNSMDHGIESAQVRAARGKPARGTLRLNAFHDSGSIVIEVTDDGGGIDTERVLAKAIERGLVEPGAALSDSEIAQLIFEPGFSTADQVSNLSGRGVGMDVVMRNVTALRGSIDVDNRPGEGCTLRIRLPLTLAIIDGFMVGVGGATFVIPLDWVVECVELPADSDKRDCMALRGEVLPFIRLRQLFSISGSRPRRENVVVVEYAGMKIGLVVDTLMGEFQTVIKPLGRLFEHVHAIGGSTILGNGEVALIIDVPLLVRQYTDRSPANNLS
jgi:two-component system chemotaxis sensor kinase CheA